MNSNNEDFIGKVAFVSGAGSGIGRATALAFAAAGANVIAADRNAEDNQQTVDLITSRDGNAIATHCDVTSSDDIQAALRQGIDTFGRLDIAFNNAGVELRPTLAADISEADWDRVLNINLRGVFLCMKYEIPLLLEHGGGSDRQYVLRSRRQGLPRRRGIRRVQVRSDRPHQIRRARLRRRQRPDQRHLPRDHRHPDDGPIHRRHRRRPRGRRCPRTHRPHGTARRNRRCRALALLTRIRLHRRTRTRHRRRTNDLTHAARHLHPRRLPPTQPSVGPVVTVCDTRSAARPRRARRRLVKDKRCG